MIGAKLLTGKLTPGKADFPPLLGTIPDAPKQLFYLGEGLNKLLERPCVAIVGSRRVSAYGKVITQKLAGGLAKRGIVIISGLALGVDGLAHQAALDSGGQTIAVMPCGLDRIYPSSHHALAKSILSHGGVLVSEYTIGVDPRHEHFIARNRIVSGLSNGVLITEAAEKSGTLHTANFALEQGREVMAVPGNITSPLSAGTNNLIKAGATPVTESRDVLRALHIKTSELQQQELVAANQEEHTILTLIKGGINEGNLLLAKSRLEPALFNQTLTMLEISGKIKIMGNNSWCLA